MSARDDLAEVLAEHPGLYGAYEWTCSGCGVDVGNLSSGKGPQFLAAHQADMLTAAGFGSLRDEKRVMQLGALMAYDAVEESKIRAAKAEALEYAADNCGDRATGAWLRFHAAYVRGGE